MFKMVVVCGVGCTPPCKKLDILLVVAVPRLPRYPVWDVAVGSRNLWKERHRLTDGPQSTEDLGVLSSSLRKNTEFLLAVSNIQSFLMTMR